MRTMGRLPVFIVTLLAVLSGTAAYSGESLDRGRTLVDSGRLEEARSLLDSLLAHPDSLSAPDRAEAAYLRAVAEENGEEFELRLRSLLGEDISGAREAWIHLSLGKIYFSKGNLQQALKEFQLAREGGRIEEGSLWEGLTAYALGDGPGARTALERVQDSGNDAIRLHAQVILGNTYRASGNLDEALSVYRRVREKEEPGSGWWSTAALLEAEVLEAEGTPDKAILPLKEILAKAPGSYEAPEAWLRLRDITDTDVSDLPEGGGSSPTADSEGEGGTDFSVQVGAFSFDDNAQGLAAHVRDNGFADARVAKGQDGLFRVLVGHLDSREGAESLGDSLSTVLGLGFSVVQGH